MSATASAAACSTVVALLRATVDGDDRTADGILNGLDHEALFYVCAAAILMLARETLLACADASVTVDDYLQVIGLACAELETEMR